MKKQVLMGALAMGAMTVGSLGQINSAKAAILSCPSSIENKVSSAIGCEYSTTYDQDNPAGVVNDEGGFFNFTDWTRLLKSDESGSVPTYFSSADGASGTFDLSSIIPSTASEVMLIFKSGQNPLVGYLLGGNIGNWSTPFTDPPFDLPGNSKTQDVSHISVYYRGQSTPIPTPALLPSLIGMGLAAMRKKKQAAGVTQEV